MGTRLELHQMLYEELSKSIIPIFEFPFSNESLGKKLINFGEVKNNEKVLHLYFNPPENLKLIYPCLIYSRQSGDTSFADNKPYFHKIRYQLMLIDKDPDSIFVEKIMELPSCIYTRHFTQNNLNHDVFNLYY